MPDEKDRKREAPISYRPPKKLREEFYRRAEQSGLSLSAFITKSVFEQDPPRRSRRPAVEAELLARLLAEAAKIRDALSDVSSEDDNTAEIVEAAYQELAEIRAACFKALGRLP